MTRYEYASQDAQSMAIMTSFCIATYLEQLKEFKFTDDEMREFLTKVSPDIELWLKNETEFA